VTRATPSGDRDNSDWLLALLAAGTAFAGVLWLGAMLASVLAGAGVPVGGLSAALASLRRPADPWSAWTGRAPCGYGMYWACTALVLIFASTALALVLRHHAGGRRGVGKDVRRLPGLASSREAMSAASERVVMRRGKLLRPALARVEHPQQIGYQIGRLRGRQLWCTAEDSALLVGPPRMGKGLHVVVPWVLDAPGAVVCTSTRPDTLAITLHARAKSGPVAIFDPQRLAGLPDGLRWSPVRGCENPHTALVRARGLSAGAGFGKTVSDTEFWAGQTETALRCLMHAAALDGRRARDLYRWSLNPALAEDAVTILNRNDRAASGWADALDAVVHSDPRTRDSVWLGVRQSLSALANPDVLEALEPTEKNAFEPSEFLQQRGTLYLLASSVSSASCAPLVAAFIEDITETARALAARAAGARLDPPLLLALDEIANLTPLPSLPTLMAEGGGSGITTLAVLQSLAQARNRWGEHAADTIWDAATVKLILGGLAKMHDLEDVARLLGEVDEPTRTTSRGGSGERTSSISMRQMPVMPPSALRTLPFGTAVLLLRQSRPMVVDLQPWPKRDDARSLLVGKQEVEAATAGRRALRLEVVGP
jgi:type IV secretion system protein VirD4